MSAAHDLSLCVRLMTDMTYDVVLTAGGIEYKKAVATEVGAMMVVAETQGFFEAAGITFVGRVTAPGRERPR